MTNVLIIDDDEDVRAIARLSLEKLGGFGIMEADGGQAGIARVQQTRPDVILLDLMMPDMDGLQCLEQLELRLGSDLPPVLLMTARTSGAQSWPSTLRGVIAKPFDPRTLVERVRQVCST